MLCKTVYGMPCLSTMLSLMVPVHTTSTTLLLATRTLLLGAGSSIVSNRSSRFVTDIVAPESETNAVFGANVRALCFAVLPCAMLNATGSDRGGLLASATSAGLATRLLRTTDDA